MGVQVKIRKRKATKKSMGEKRALPGRNRVSIFTVIKAIQGSGGIMRRIAERLDLSYQHTSNLIRSTPELAQALAEERERVGDIAEATVQDIMRQRMDIGEAGRNARWYVERKHADRGFAERSIHQIEGGNNPLHIKNETLLPLESLDLPIEVRKTILDAMAKKENAEKESA